MFPRHDNDWQASSSSWQKQFQHNQARFELVMHRGLDHPACFWRTESGGTGRFRAFENSAGDASHAVNICYIRFLGMIMIDKHQAHHEQAADREKNLLNQHALREGVIVNLFFARNFWSRAPEPLVVRWRRLKALCQSYELVLCKACDFSVFESLWRSILDYWW